MITTTVNSLLKLVDPVRVEKDQSFRYNCKALHIWNYQNVIYRQPTHAVELNNLLCFKIEKVKDFDQKIIVNNYAKWGVSHEFGNFDLVFVIIKLTVQVCLSRVTLFECN